MQSISETYPGESVGLSEGDTFRYPLCLCHGALTKNFLTLIFKVFLLQRVFFQSVFLPSVFVRQQNSVPFFYSETSILCFLENFFFLSHKFNCVSNFEKMQFLPILLLLITNIARIANAVTVTLYSKVTM